MDRSLALAEVDPRGVTVLDDDHTNAAGEPKLRIFTPEEIAETLGGISVKTVTDLIRAQGLETTTLGYAAPSRKGGPPRRLWGMTDLQLQALFAVRRRRSSGRRPGSR